MVIKAIIDLDNGELLEATGKHRISALDIQGSETATLNLTFYKDGKAVTDSSVLTGASIDFGVKADADYTGASYLVYHNTFSASSDGLTFTGTPTWATAEVETALGNESSVKLHSQVKVVINAITYYSQVFEVEIHNNVIQAAGSTSSVIFPRLITKTSDPTANDDSLDGYGVSSIWLNTSTNAVHVLMDNTAGAAVWAGFLGLTNGQLANNLVFNDNLKAVFGTSSDGLEIYHSSDESYIDDSGTGRLFIRSNGSGVFLQKTDGENLAKFKTDGATELYFDGSKKIESTNLGCTVTGKLIVSGDLNVDGTTTTFNSTVVNVDDPVFGIGGDTAPGSQDNKDRGVSFRYHDGASAKVGFYGWDNSENAFTFLTDTNDDSTEVFSGTLGNLKSKDITLSGGTLQLDSAYAIQWANGNNRIFGSSGNNYIRFDTNGAEAARFDSSGQLITKNKIKIEHATPVFELNDTSSGATTTFTLDGTSTTINNQGTGGGLIFSTQGTEAARFNSDQSFQVGANGSGNDVYFYGNSTDKYLKWTAQSRVLHLQDLTTFAVGTGLDLQIYHSTHTYIENTTNDLYLNNNASGRSTIFKIGGTEAMRLNSTGLGIGGAPSAKLDVQLEAGAWNVGSSFTNKAVRISGGSGGLGLAYDDTTGATIAAIHHGNSWKNLNLGAVQYIFDINGSEVMRLNSTGLGIGGTPSAKLDVYAAPNTNSLFLRDSSDSEYTHNFYVDASGNGHTTMYAEGNAAKIAFSTSGDSYFNGGSVGIANTNPSAQYFNNLVIGNNDAGDKGLTIRSSSSDRGIIAFSDSDSATADRYDGFIAYEHANQALAFYTNAANERMRINSTGSVSIGNANEYAKLYVQGNSATLPAGRFYQQHSTGDGLSISTEGETSAEYALKVDSDGGLKPLIYARADGNVGIGTLNPSTIFQIDTGDASGNKFGLTGDGSTTGAALWTNWTTGTSYLDFRLGGTSSTYTKMRVQYDGKVGIGTTSPDTLLHLKTSSQTGAENMIQFSRGSYESGMIGRDAGDLVVSGESNLILAADYNANGGSSDSNIIFKTDNTEKARLDSDGDLELKIDGKGLIVSSPDGTRYKITCANGGAITSTAM
jgi:hypothetical protein